MVLGKRAVFFTLASIFFVAALMLVFRINQPVDRYDTKIEQVRVLNEYRDKLENLYIPLVAKHKSYDALYRISIESINRPLPRYLILPDDWNDAMMRGDLAAVPLSNFQTLPQAYNNLSNFTLQLGYYLDITVHNISMIQSGPYQASFTINYSYNLSTQDNKTRYNRNITQTGAFSLVGIPDAYYTRKLLISGTREYRYFRPHILVGGWNNASVVAMLGNRSYRASNLSPDVFMRLQGVPGQSPWGVETFLAPTLDPATHPILGKVNRTSVDWEFFQPNDYDCTYEIPALFGNTKLSLQQVFDYNVTGAQIAYDGLGNCAAAP